MQARLVALLLATEPEAARAHALHELQVRMACMCYVLHKLLTACMHLVLA